MEENNDILKRHKVALNFLNEIKSITNLYFYQSLKIDTKMDGSFVTVCDKEIEEKFRNIIKLNFSGDRVFGEEFPELNPDKSDLLDIHGEEYIWTIDPIDGTASFAHGVPLYGSLIGLIYAGVPVYGLMYLPEFDEIYYSLNGKETFFTNLKMSFIEKCSLNKGLDQKEHLLLFSTFDSFRRVEMVNFFKKILRFNGTIRSWGDAFGHSLVLKNKAHLIVDPNLKVWDFTPLNVLYKGASVSFERLNKSNVDAQIIEGDIIAGHQSLIDHFLS